MAQQGLSTNLIIGGKKMENLKSIITNEKVKGAIAIVAAVVMFFTPNHIDLIIESLLAAFGIQKLVMKKKDE